MATSMTTSPSLPHSADSQLSSLFFTHLPAEIRNLIYLEYWKLCSVRQHIFKYRLLDNDRESYTEAWAHVPCRADLEAPDTRFEELGQSVNGSPERELWGKRLRSEWCLHWMCEEDAKAVGERMKEASESQQDGAPVVVQHSHGPGNAGILTALLVCKRMYLECLPSLYNNTTFILTDTRTAVNFLSRYVPNHSDDASSPAPKSSVPHPIRSLELSIRVPNIITEIYYPSNPNTPGGDDGPPAVFAAGPVAAAPDGNGTLRGSRSTLNARNNPWRHLCDTVVALLPLLRHLHIWLDSSDLRPWHKRVSETRFFGPFLDLPRPHSLERFVLSLPGLPVRRGPDTHALTGQYLENEVLERLPFVVKRGPRPDNMRVHMRNIVHFGAVGFPPQPTAATVVVASGYSGGGGGGGSTTAS
ncbi:uncharacterized protein C8A04DRAFT_11351 [Dichotomopilus funicola]|uniref:DUF7730 domain-containing protein n=1 Tax=Dichotomopilus funicola TaxID=1934379 RepID=A0AAN6V4G5_9PEZI|nr:hypothetical protein C8A04DRAFT_11351 [Dichotomopilus funicola]